MWFKQRKGKWGEKNKNNNIESQKQQSWKITVRGTHWKNLSIYHGGEEE